MMKKLILLATLSLCALTSQAQLVNATRVELGSEQLNAHGLENATKWSNDIYHAPQYMPGYPTAATLYPRVVDVQCKKTVSGLNCKGYNWTPDMGRAEYLMIRPVVLEDVPAPVTTVIIREVIAKALPPEIATKKIGE